MEREITTQPHFMQHFTHSSFEGEGGKGRKGEEGMVFSTRHTTKTMQVEYATEIA